MPSGSVFQSTGLISYRINETQGVRERGRFTAQGLSAMRERNRQMAESIQQKTASLIESRIIWREESTGRLVKNTLASDNAQYDTWRVAVGNPDFLDRSTSKYWRTVEQGSARVWTHPFVGTHLWGRFGRAGASKGQLTGFWTDEEGKAPFVVGHEIQGQEAYGDAAIEVGLKEFAIKNIQRTVADILAT